MCAGQPAWPGGANTHRERKNPANRAEHAVSSLGTIAKIPLANVLDADTIIKRGSDPRRLEKRLHASTGCACPERHLDPLGAHAELVFPWAGVLVLPDDYEDFSEISSGGMQLGSELQSHRFNHGILHFVQALGSPFLADHGLRLGRAAYAVVSGGDGHDAFEREAGRLRRPHPSGVSCEDLLESAAVLEANRLDIPVSGFVHRTHLDRLYPDPAAPQRRGFEHVAGRIGDDDACELLALLTFLAFIHDDPCEAFDYLLQVVGQAPEMFKSLEAAQILDLLGWADEYERYWDCVAAGKAIATPYIVDPLREAMRRLGRSALLETLARPSAHLNALPEPELRAVEPPVIVFPSRAGALVHHRNGVALDVDPDFAGRAIVDVAIFGAAERLTLARQAAEPAYCAHHGCPHHRAGLCSRWYLPPSTATGHDSCQFPDVLAHVRATAP